MRKITFLILLSSIYCTSCKKPPSIWYEDFEEPEEPLGEITSRSLVDYKLPGDIAPIVYGIKLKPYMDDAVPAERQFTFDGSVNIVVFVLKATDRIRLHAKELDIKHVSVKELAGHERINVTNIVYSKDDRNFLDIYLKEELYAEERYEIDIKYTGILNEDLEGFYRSSYEERGEKKWMFATQFEPTGARRAFPCFDEPAMKARFKVIIATPPNWTTLSNKPVYKITRIENQTGYFKNWRWVDFLLSRSMSTYLVAFTMSRFANITSSEDKRFQVWARPERIQDCELAVLIAPLAVKYMESETNIPYTFHKLDQIALPDFAAGAMENWGLITYSEDSLFYNEANSTAHHYKYTSDTIFHEIAHQWFGNLVTPTWWGNLWLNEGFATYLSYHISEHVSPWMDSQMQFILDEYASALIVDARESAHPLVDNSVDSPNKIDSIFDTISYSKGGCIVRMMLNFMGHKNFWKGIHCYIKYSEFSNADQDDLWRGLSTAIPNGLLPSNVELKDIMDTWALQAGYPVVTVTRDYDKNTVSFTQKRFFSSAPVKKDHNEVYWVPLTMLVQGEPKENGNRITWLHKKTITMDSPSSDKWILVNNEKNGYYRVNYDKENWKKLSESINGAQLVNTLSVNNRVQLLMDSLALARTKELDYETALGTTAYLNYENEQGPWKVALRELSQLERKISTNNKLKVLFKEYLMDKIDHLYKHFRGFDLSLKSDSLALRLQRTETLNWLCSNGHEACNKDGHAIFNEMRTNKKRKPYDIIHPDIRQTVYESGVRMGGEEEFNFLAEKYQNEKEKLELQYILYGLAATNNKEYQIRLLNESTTLNSTTFINKHASLLFQTVQNNPNGTETAFDFLINNYFKAKDAWHSSGKEFSLISKNLHTEEHMQKLKNFLERNSKELTEEERKHLNKAISTVEANIQWNKENTETILTFLSSKPPSSGTLVLVSNTILVIAFLFSKLL